MTSPIANTRRVTSQAAGASSDDTSASFSVSSSDKACDPGTKDLGRVFLAKVGGAREAGESQVRETTAYALPARQVRADSAPERGTKDLASAAVAGLRRHDR